MKNIKTRIISLIATLAVVLGFAFGTSGVAEAGTYWNSTACSHAAYTKFICYDASSGQVVIQTGVGSQVGYAASSAFTPTKGYIAYDTYECNAAAPSYDTAFATPGYYGIPTSVQYVVDDGGAPAAGNIYVSQSGHDLIAWYANTQSGFACFVVP